MPNILHFGIGNFHRAHQAWYTQQANDLQGEQWRITGVSLRSPAIRDALSSQDYTYTLAIKDAFGAKNLKMNVHDGVLVGGEDDDRIIDLIADPQTKVITITVSEKGYHLDPTGALDLTSPTIAAELASGTPTSVIGFIAHGLAKRHATHGQPINVISCDNLPDNGHKLRDAVMRFCAESQIDMADYLAHSVSFPNTMIDRIVPATTDALRAQINAETGTNDAHPIATETFSEWYIENRLTATTPAWDKVGVQIVDDVAPFELRKLRLLNGAHSYLAYAGLNAGHQYVHEAIADPTLLSGAIALMDEAAETLPVESRSDADAYRDALLERFRNPNLNHELRQIAMDGSLKLPIRILPVMSERKTNGRASPMAENAVSEWVRYIIRCLRLGVTLNDPKHDLFVALADKFEDDIKLTQALTRELGAGDLIIS